MLEMTYGFRPGFYVEHRNCRTLCSYCSEYNRIEGLRHDVGASVKVSKALPDDVSPWLTFSGSFSETCVAAGFRLDERVQHQNYTG